MTNAIKTQILVLDNKRNLPLNELLKYGRDTQ